MSRLDRILRIIISILLIFIGLSISKNHTSMKRYVKALLLLLVSVFLFTFPSRAMFKMSGEVKGMSKNSREVGVVKIKEISQRLKKTISQYKMYKFSADFGGNVKREIWKLNFGLSIKPIKSPHKFLPLLQSLPPAP